MAIVKTLAERIKECIDSGLTVVPAKAHATISKGMVVQLATGTGNTAAPDANDRLGFWGVALEDVDSGAEGRFKIDGFVYLLSGAAITLGSLVDCSADMKVDALGVQTNGNGFARVLETASDADQLVLAKIL